MYIYVLVSLCTYVGVETNPYNSPNDRGFVSRNEPSLRRTLSVRGSILYKPNYQVRKNLYSRQ